MNQPVDESMICVGVITSAHGIKGAVNIKSFTTNPSDLTQYGPIYNKNKSKQYHVKVLSVKKDRIIAMLDNLGSRNDAEKLKGEKLYITRSSLPVIEDENEFYSEDLIGLTVLLNDGQEFGKVVSLNNYGSCDILEIQLIDSDKKELVAFTEDLVPEINLEEGFIVVDLPQIEFVGDNDNNAT